jgi:hypothetical protein
LRKKSRESAAKGNTQESNNESEPARERRKERKKEYTLRTRTARSGEKKSEERAGRVQEGSANAAAGPQPHDDCDVAFRNRAP